MKELQVDESTLLHPPTPQQSSWNTYKFQTTAWMYLVKSC